MPLFDITKHQMICSKGDFKDVYVIQQINGQLISTFKHVPQPRRGTEVFIKKLPRDILLQDIFEFAVRCGDIYRIRLLMDFSGFNRGYCFVTYFDINSARKAILTLNGEEITPDFCVYVKMSFDNNKLEVRGIPPGVNRDQIYNVMSEIIGIGLIGVITFKNSNKVTYTNKCVLKYDSHRHALEARKQVWPSIRLWRKCIEIDWAVPHEVLNSRRLYFRNAPKEITKLQMYEAVTKHVEPSKMLNMFLQDGLGYILFINGSDAFDAYSKLRTEEICGEILEFSFTKFYSSLQGENKDRISGEPDSSDTCSEKTLSEGTIVSETQSSSTLDSLQEYASSSTENSIAARTSSTVAGSVISTVNSSTENDTLSPASQESWNYTRSSTEDFLMARTSSPIAGRVVSTDHSSTEIITDQSDLSQESSTNQIDLQPGSEFQWPMQLQQNFTNAPNANRYFMGNVALRNAEIMHNNFFPLMVVPNPIITLTPNTPFAAYNNMVRIMPRINHIQYDLTLVQVPRMSEYHY